MVDENNDYKNIWDRVENALSIGKSNTEFDLWNSIDEHYNPYKYKPKRKENVEIAQIDSKGGAITYMLRNTANDKYIILGDKELYLWKQMDGSNTVKNLYLELIMEYGLTAQSTLFSFLQILKANNFLHDSSTSVYLEIDKTLSRHKILYRVKSVINFLMSARLTTKKADQFFAWLYKRLKVVYHKISFFLMLVMLIINLGLTSYFLFYKHETILLTPHTGPGSHDVIYLMVITYFSVFIHEIAHGLTVKHYDRKVLRAGFMLLFGSPIAYVDTTDILMKGRYRRIGVSFSGPCINGVIGGILLFIALIHPESIHENLMLHAGLVNSMLFVLNLIPFTETDGHYIIQDWLMMPQLRQESLRFLKLDIWKILIGKEKWQKKHFGFLFYGSISVLGIYYLLMKGIHLWAHSGQHLLEEALSNPRMVIEVILFWVFLVLLIVFLRRIARYRSKKNSITNLLEFRLMTRSYDN
ncbi:M50 family metallopeptidase [Mobilitalea sibirica]|uniref:M50 family metallopeptidase n=1 Tax=Mobilitalea sibirica TaxID=1462919 RepID=A0A8J7HCD7_9FIRM|nr:M50 family metallopeptidase [Mobilitalea sibirica]MBH1939949.1 M50 family metallopeptidase [Mobilitalea sibirica]